MILFYLYYDFFPQNKNKNKKKELWSYILHIQRTIQDVNDVQAGFNDEDNRNKCDNEANKVQRKEEMGGTNNDTHSMHVKKIFFYY